MTTTATLSSKQYSTKASPAIKSATPSFWTLLGKSLQMARIVGDNGLVTERKMARVRALAASL